jgi:hypothetical protein
MKVNRIFEGAAITHPFGFPKYDNDNEHKLRVQKTSKVLETLTQ